VWVGEDEIILHSHHGRESGHCGEGCVDCVQELVLEIGMRLLELGLCLSLGLCLCLEVGLGVCEVLGVVFG
jgi:hypothetical protein